MEYLDRAKKLRAVAAEMHDLRVRDAMIGSAEAYERMASSLDEMDPPDSTRASSSRNSLVAGFELALSYAVAVFVRLIGGISRLSRRINVSQSDNPAYTSRSSAGRN